MNKMTAASKTLPFGTKLVVKNLKNGRSCEVVINDRGPYVRGRGIDLSHEAARRIGISGIGRVLCYNSASPKHALHVPQVDETREAPVAAPVNETDGVDDLSTETQVATKLDPKPPRAETQVASNPTVDPKPPRGLTIRRHVSQNMIATLPRRAKPIVRERVQYVAYEGSHRVTFLRSSTRSTSGIIRTYKGFSYRNVIASL